MKENINLLKTYHKYIYENPISFPTINFYEKPYIIDRKFFDENLINFFTKMKNNMF